MPIYPLHQPIDITTGEKKGDPNRRDGVFIDAERNRADVLIVDERAPFNTATHVATDTEVASPLPFDPATTRWRLQRTTRAKTAQELSDDAKNNDRAFLRNAVLLMAQVQTTLVDKLLQKGVIVNADFDAATRQMYLDLKAKVDALR